MINKSITYTEPALCHYNYDITKAWFVYFDITNEETKETVRKQSRRGINHFKEKSDRIKAAKMLISLWKEQLKAGWHPFEGSKVNDLLLMNFKQAVEFALSKCEVAADTLKCYRCTSRFILKGSDYLRLSAMPIVDMKRVHIKTIMEHCRIKNKWSNTAFNRHLNFLQAILSRLVKWEVIEHNPAHKIEGMRVTETEKYVPYTDAERTAIQEHLFVNHYRYFVYLHVLYSTGIRPKEVLSLKIKHVDLINMQINIYPDIKTENSKTKNIRKVPISKQLLPFLRELGLKDYDRDHYVFGSTNQIGKGNCGSAKGGKRGAMHPDYWKPSPVRIKRDTATKFWKKVIMDGLGIQKYLYAAKATGANAMILAGIDLETLKEMYGHTSRLMTERYASVVKKVRFNEIVENGPVF